MSRVAVLGGGISGLASAALLAADGHEVTLFEQAAQLGGRAGSWERDGFRFDTGPSWYLMPEVFEHCFRLLGTSAAAELDLVRLDPAYRLFADGAAPLDVHSDRERSLALFESVEPGAGAALARHLDSAARTARIANDRFLYTDFSHPKAFLPGGELRELPRLATLLGTSLRSMVEASFSDRRLRQILQYPAVFLGGSPDIAPALFHLMSSFDLAEGVLYPRGGFTTVIEAFARLAREAGARLHTGARVHRILVDGGAVRGVVVAREGLVREERFDRVVSTVDMHHSDTALLPGAARERPLRHWRRANPGTGAVLAMLGVRGRLPGSSITTSSSRRTGMRTSTRSSAMRPGCRIPRPSTPAPPVGPMIPSRRRVTRTCSCSSPCRPTPRSAPGRRRRRRVRGRARRRPRDRRARGARGRPRPRRADRRAAHHRARGLRPRPALLARLGAGPGAHHAAERVPARPHPLADHARLFYAGATTLPGIGLPMCLISAELVLKAFRGDRTTGPLPVPEAVR